MPSFNLSARRIRQKRRSGNAPCFGLCVNGVQHTALHADIGAHNLCIGLYQRHSQQKRPFGYILGRLGGDLLKGGGGGSVSLRVLKVQLQRINGVLQHIVKGVSGRKAARHVGEMHAECAVRFFVNNGNKMFHVGLSYIQPACLAMLRAVPFGRSFFGCGTITVLSPLRNFWCEPLAEINSNPSAFRRLIICLLFRSIHNYIHTWFSNCKVKCVDICAKESNYK